MKRLVMLLGFLISVLLMQGCVGFGVYSTAGVYTGGFYYDNYPYYHSPPVYHYHQNFPHDHNGWVDGHHYRNHY